MHRDEGQGCKVRAQQGFSRSVVPSFSLAEHHVLLQKHGSYSFTCPLSNVQQPISYLSNTTSTEPLNHSSSLTTSTAYTVYTAIPSLLTVRSSYVIHRPLRGRKTYYRIFTMRIPVYTNNPINAAKADGITPKTADTPSSALATAPAPAPAPATTTLMPMLTSSFTPAQPGVAPVPAPTDSRGQPTRPATNYTPSPLTPTPTQVQQYDGPPPPQPGAAPQLPGHATSKLPPPPKSGEKYVSPSQSPETRTQAMPAQMRYGSLASAYQPPSMSTAQASTPSQTYPTPLAYHSPAVGSDEDRLEHPPG